MKFRATFLGTLALVSSVASVACEREEVAKPTAPDALGAASGSERSGALEAAPGAAIPRAAMTAAAAATSAPDSAARVQTAPAPTAISAQHILIAYRGAERAEKSIRRTKNDARKLAEKVAGEAKSGTDFSELVSKYSEDPSAKERRGSLGKFTREKMHKTFSDAAFKLEVNQVSAAVETPFGFHVIKRNQ